jgi:tetratricopeptide (TPR) repeat protein
MYRDVIKDERDVPSRDGLSLMVVASAYYAIGKFDPALSVLQRAGIELSKKISTSPEYTVYCAKLFNNMGCVYFEMGKYEKAMQAFQRALQLFHNDDGCNYTAWVAAILDQSSIMNNMAYTLIKFKQYDDASDLVDTSFELQQILPENADKTMLISTLSTMAFIYYRTKKYKQSLDTYTGKEILFHR